MLASWLHGYAADVAALLFNSVAFASYRAVRRRRERRDPTVTLQSQQVATRAEWVSEVLRSGNGILGVQTLRNALMASLFFASNTMFLVMGVLSLTAQQHLGEVWAVLDPGSTTSLLLVQAKLLLLLLTLIFAFFCFISGIRLFSHASLSIGTKTATPSIVTAQLDAAWSYQGLGVRCYYFAAPVLLWLFGTLWFVLGGIAAIAVMHVFDSVHARSRPSN